MTRLAAQVEAHHHIDEKPSPHKVGRLFTVDYVANRMDVPKSTVYEAVRQNRIGGIVRLGRIVRFEPEKFEEWIESGGQALPGGWKQEAEE